MRTIGDIHWKRVVSVLGSHVAAVRVYTKSIGRRCEKCEFAGTAALVFRDKAKDAGNTTDTGDVL
ncbi:MAG: hypothetical protein LBV45_05510 [Xanthomonadaceae bacterium]|nr:hypothetical protein [Xanthomonadaceae bacterium]